MGSGGTDAPVQEARLSSAKPPFFTIGPEGRPVQTTGAGPVEADELEIAWLELWDEVWLVVLCLEDVVWVELCWEEEV